MEEREAIAELKAAGMPESQAQVLVRVVRAATACGSPCGDGTPLDRVALQDEVRRFSHELQEEVRRYSYEVSRQIEAESRFYIGCTIGIYAAMYALLRLIP